MSSRYPAHRSAALLHHRPEYSLLDAVVSGLATVACGGSEPDDQARRMSEYAAADA